MRRRISLLVAATTSAVVIVARGAAVPAGQHARRGPCDGEPPTRRPATSPSWSRLVDDDERLADVVAEPRRAAAAPPPRCSPPTAATGCGTRDDPRPGCTPSPRRERHSRWWTTTAARCCCRSSGPTAPLWCARWWRRRTCAAVSARPGSGSSASARAAGHWRWRSRTGSVGGSASRSSTWPPPHTGCARETWPPAPRSGARRRPRSSPGRSTGWPIARPSCSPPNGPRSADLSHRLRTPVTALRLDTEAVSDAEVAERLQLHVATLQRTIDAIVKEARRPVRTDLAPGCDATATVRDRLEFWRPLADDQQRPMEVALPDEPVPVPLDRADLTDLVDVLVDNVFAHTPEGTPLRVSLRHDPGDSTCRAAGVRRRSRLRRRPGAPDREHRARARHRRANGGGRGRQPSGRRRPRGRRAWSRSPCPSYIARASAPTEFGSGRAACSCPVSCERVRVRVWRARCRRSHRRRRLHDLV